MVTLIQLKIKGQPPSKKSGQQIVYKRGKPRILPNAKYLEWKKEATNQIEKWKQGYCYKNQRMYTMIRQPIRIHMKCLCYRWTYKSIDLINILQSVADELEANEILENDTQICKTDGSEIIYGCAKEDARVWINLEFDPQDQWCYDDCKQMFKSRAFVKCRRHKGIMETNKDKSRFYRLKNCKTWGE